MLLHRGREPRFYPIKVDPSRQSAETWKRIQQLTHSNNFRSLQHSRSFLKLASSLRHIITTNHYDTNNNNNIGFRPCQILFHFPQNKKKTFTSKQFNLNELPIIEFRNISRVLHGFCFLFPLHPLNQLPWVTPLTIYSVFSIVISFLSLSLMMELILVHWHFLFNQSTNV